MKERDDFHQFSHVVYRTSAYLTESYRSCWIMSGNVSPLRISFSCLNALVFRNARRKIVSQMSDLFSSDSCICGKDISCKAGWIWVT